MLEVPKIIKDLLFDARPDQFCGFIEALTEAETNSVAMLRFPLSATERISIHFSSSKSQLWIKQMIRTDDLLHILWFEDVGICSIMNLLEPLVRRPLFAEMSCSMNGCCQPKSAAIGSWAHCPRISVFGRLGTKRRQPQWSVKQQRPEWEWEWEWHVMACHQKPMFLQCFSTFRIPNDSRGLKKNREKPWEKPMEPMGYPHRGNMDMTGKLSRMQAKACWAGRFWEGPWFSEMFGQDQPELLNVS